MVRERVIRPGVAGAFYECSCVHTSTPMMTSAMLREACRLDAARRRYCWNGRDGASVAFARGLTTGYSLKVARTIVFIWPGATTSSRRIMSPRRSTTGRWNWEIDGDSGKAGIN